MTSRYDRTARVYDLISGERLLYRKGRRLAIDLFEPREGDRVLVVGCGTGLDLPYLVDRVGPGGEIIGVDVSGRMLDQARRRTARAGWGNVLLVRTDAATLDGVLGTFDAALFSYSLAVIEDWAQAWHAATGRLRPGGRVAVVDTDLPDDGGTITRLLARAAMHGGGVDHSRRVWQLVSDNAVDVRHGELAGGHIQVTAGTWPGA